MMRRLKFLAPLVAVLALAGCGGSSHSAAPTPHCTGGNYAMSCVHIAPPVGLAPPTSAVLAYGIDFAWGCPSPSGHAFGASYLSYDSSKNWTGGCVNWWHSAGAKTVAVWESSATRATQGYYAGRSDALAAKSQAANLGNTTRPIFFAIDCDCTGGQVASYFQGVRSVLPKSRTGAYGGKTPITYLFNAGLIGYGWQTYAWSGGAWDSRAKLQQYLNGATVDYDRATASDYGQWPYTAPVLYPLCYTHRIPAKQCRTVKAQVVKDQRAAASSLGAYDKLGGPVLAQRIQWFAKQIKLHPKSSKTASRKRALAASRKVWTQHSLGIYFQRYQWFAARASALRQAN